MLPFKELHKISSRLSKSFLPMCSLHTSVSFSTQSSKALSFKHILSDENKQRVQAMKASFDPVRNFEHVPSRDHQNVAAVLVPLCLVHNEPSLLFTLRSTNLKKHRGQVSFPGGHVDESDSSLAATALRETEEELGIPSSIFDVWGQLNPLPTGDGKTVVYPILASTGEIDISSLCINKSEVEEVFTVTIEHLCDPHNIGVTRYRTGSSYTLPVYSGAAHRIWGLTAIMVHQLLPLLAPDFYHFKLKHVRPYKI